MNPNIFLTKLFQVIILKLYIFTYVDITLFFMYCLFFTWTIHTFKIQTKIQRIELIKSLHKNKIFIKK